jgi:type I restriction enzyme S subunit
MDEVAEVNPSKLDPETASETPFNFVPMSAVTEEFGGIDVSTLRPYSEVRKGYTQFQAGDVLFAKITPCMENGKIAVVPELANICGYGSTEFHVLRPGADIPAKWIAYYLVQAGFRRDAQRSMSGSAGQLRVPKDWLKAQRLPLAPIPEQHQIVAKIEELFSDLDAGVAALERAKANLKRYRAAVLKAAVEGKLTEQWRAENPDVESASELLERILAERRKKWEQEQLAKYEAKGKKPPQGWKDKYREPETPAADLPTPPDGWCWVTVDQLLCAIEAGKSFKCLARPAAEDEWGIIKVSAMTWGEFIETENKAIPEDRQIDERFEIQQGDILLSRANTVELVGASVIVKGCRPQLVLSDKSLRLLPCDGIEREWFQKALSSRGARTQMSRVATGTSDSMRNISQEKLRFVLLLLPPVGEQREIVRETERRLSILEATEAATALGSKRANRLRQSILKEAFKGNLVEQDPNDEPASVLLDRIKTGRRQAGPVKKGHKARNDQLKLI